MRTPARFPLTGGGAQVKIKNLLNVNSDLDSRLHWNWELIVGFINRSLECIFPVSGFEETAAFACSDWA